MELPIILVLICGPYFVCGQTKRDIGNNDFHMFENFELTKSLYINETQIVEKLRSFHENLMERKNHLQKLLQHITSSRDDVNQQFNKLAHMKKRKSIRSAFSEIKDLSQELPISKDYEGSIRAIVRLQFAYHMNLTELSENGRIRYISSDGELISIENYEKLTSIDLAAFAEKAAGQKFYHIAIDFTKEALRLSKKENGVRAMQPEQMKLLQIMRKNLVSLNNG